MYNVGIDLGGTNIATGIITETGEMICSRSCITQSGQSYDTILQQIAGEVSALLRDAGLEPSAISSVGIGIPGVVNAKAGTVIQCTNLRWYKKPVQADLESLIHLPVRIENDANLAALAEYTAGAARGVSSCILLTLGTGIGGAIIENGRILTGKSGQAGEFGHMTFVADGIPCACGRFGCMEQYCSATALIRMARQILGQRPDSTLVTLTGGDLTALTAKMIIDAARDGDSAARTAFDRFTHYLAIALDSLTNLLDPEMILLGGGISSAGSFLLDAVLREFPRFEHGSPRPVPRIALASLRNHAGIIGAGLLSTQGCSFA